MNEHKAQIHEAQDVDAFRARLAEMDALPSLPTVVMELLHCVDEEETTDEKIVGLISQDSGLTARLLKLANSAAMGLRVPENLTALASRDGTAAIPVDELASATATADVLIWCTENEAERTALVADPAVAGLDNTAGRNVFTTGDLAAAIAFASPLSYPVVAGQLPALVARALG